VRKDTRSKRPTRETKDRKTERVTRKGKE
jgi:hypothetical protein